MQSKLNDVPASQVTQTLSVYIYDPCPKDAGPGGPFTDGNYIMDATVNQMTTSALKTPAVTQTLSYWPDYSSWNAGVTTMCGASTFSLVAGTYSSTYLSLSGTTLTLLSTSLADVGTHYPQIKQCLSTPAYNNVCRTKTFTVVIGGCALNSFTAPTVATQTFTIYTGTTLTISIPAYTQSPNCARPVSYTSKIKKTANANANRPSYFPDTTSQFSISSTGVTTTSYSLKFIKYNSLTESFSVYTDDLNDGGTYTIYVTATAQEDIPQALGINTDLNFQLTLVDPCDSTVVNNFVNPALNVAAATITTTVKYSGSVAPFTYQAVSHQFHTYMDSVSYNYGQYAIGLGGSYTGTES